MHFIQTQVLLTVFTVLLIIHKASSYDGPTGIVNHQTASKTENAELVNDYYAETPLKDSNSEKTTSNVDFDDNEEYFNTSARTSQSRPYPHQSFVDVNDYYDEIMDDLSDAEVLSEKDVSNPSIDSSQKSLNEKWKRETKTGNYYLSDNFVPKWYTLYITPFFENFTFHGLVSIEATVTFNTDQIILHAGHLDLKNVTVTTKSEKIEVIKIVHHPQLYGTLTIVLGSSLTSGSLVMVEISYSSNINTETKGFYKSSYIENQDQEKWVLSTQLKPIYAREMFPCIDEPRFQAVFVIHVNRPANYRSISNMQLHRSTPINNDRTWDVFKTTDLIPANMVALVIADYKTVVNDGTPKYAVWASATVIVDAVSILTFLDPLVEYFKTHLSNNYQLSILKVVIIPTFPYEAMGYYGLILSREDTMIVNDRELSIFDEQKIALALAREVCQQWLGHMITPILWNYLWLNVGFAKYFEYTALSEVMTSWNLEAQFVVEDMHRALKRDSSIFVLPMSIQIESSWEIKTFFNVFNSAKSASIIRMMEKFLGPTIFQDIIKLYLSNGGYYVKTAGNFFEAFQTQIKKHNYTLDTAAVKLMNSWINLPGYPIVQVNMSENTAHLSQKRFISLNLPYDFEFNHTWWIPITWATKNSSNFNDTMPKYWLSKENASIQMNKSNNEWIVFNVQQTGFYRVNYDNHSWSLIIDALKSENFKKIHKLNRASLMDDLFNLGISGHVDYFTVLSATQYLTRETDYIPWRATFRGLQYLYTQFLGTNIFEQFKKHVLTILEPIYNTLGFEKKVHENYSDTMLRTLVIEWACTLKHWGCISNCLGKFAAWKTDKTARIPTNLQPIHYCMVLKYGTPDDLTFLEKQHTSTSGIRLIERSLRCLNGSNAINDKDYYDISSGIMYHRVIPLNDELADSVTRDELTLARRNNNIYPIVDSDVLHNIMNKTLLDHAWYKKYVPKILLWLDKTYPSTDDRLPTTIRPTKYDIDLRVPYINDHNKSFSGNTTIYVSVYNSTSKIVLHADNINITSKIEVFDIINGYFLESTDWIINPTTQTLSIYLDTFTNTNALLKFTVNYTGILNDETKGLYQSSYLDDDDSNRYFIATNFEPTYARKVFPCFDEPWFKAMFFIRIDKSPEYNALSNMRAIHHETSEYEDEQQGPSWTSYAVSPMISTYTVAFFISDFHRVYSTYETAINVWVRPNAEKYGEYALSIGKKCQNYLESITGIKYPAEKMDMIGVPHFLEISTSQTWSLTIFKEDELLLDVKPSESFKKSVTLAIAREFVQMWFGSLVTHEWWDYFSLNKGFAMYFQWNVVASMEPSWNCLQQVVVYQVQEVMQQDADKSNRVLYKKVSTPSEIEDTFDTITYNKAGNIIRMMDHSFDPITVNRALRDYLSKYKFNTVKPEYLWTAIQTKMDDMVLPTSVETIMNSWINHAGFPVVNATNNLGMVVLSQERFLYKKKNLLAFHHLYWIPISYTTESVRNFEDTTPKMWLGRKKQRIDRIIKSNEWFIINVQEAGYYRVNYDQATWNRLVSTLNSDSFNNIHVTNRAQIIDDLLNLARAGYVQYGLALNATLYLTRESSHIPWYSFANNIVYLHNRFEGHDIKGVFSKYILFVIDKMYNKIGFVDSSNITANSHLDGLNKEMILSLACRYGHKGCIRTSRSLFRAWRKGDSNQQISPNARKAVYCTAMKYGDYEDWHFLWTYYKKAQLDSDMLLIIDALGCTSDTLILRKYLSCTLFPYRSYTNEHIRRIFHSVASAGQVGLEITLQFLTRNYQKLRNRYGSFKSIPVSFKILEPYISTSEQIAQLKQFISSNSDILTEVSTSLNDIVSNAEDNLQWYEDHHPSILTWLNKLKNLKN